MDRDEVGRRELRTLYLQLRDFRPPRLGALVDVAGDFDVDLYYEEDEVVGLAGAFLEGRPANQAAIFLDPSIDERLAMAARALPSEPLIAAFASYRGMVRELAVALSGVSGMPILERTSEDRLHDSEA